jgi:hypothetical protein
MFDPPPDATGCGTISYRTRLLFPEQQIDHETAPDVRPVAPAVGQDVGVVTPGVFEGISEYRHPVEGPVFVDAPGKADDRGSPPVRFSG